MATSTAQDRKFIDEVISYNLLELSIDWISSHMQPEDVFSMHDLESWAEDSGYTKEAP